jgi:Ser-tRNA(Ala) deacylase AlaX
VQLAPETERLLLSVAVSAAAGGASRIAVYLRHRCQLRVAPDVIRQDLPVRYAYVTEADALAEHGLIRNRSVAPPPAPDGTIRVVEIVGLDRQACGGTHLASTAGSRPLRILKIDNKGRKIGLTGLSQG